MTTVIVTVFEAADLAISEKKTETLLRTPDQAALTLTLVIEAADLRYKHKRPSFFT